MATPLIIGDEQVAQLSGLRELASEHPVDMPALMTRIETPEGKRRHMDQMNSQSVWLPLGFLVTFSIETGHPAGTARHMSLSSTTAGRTPTPKAVWMIATHLGFIGGIERCAVWPEELLRGDERAVAINLVQPIALTDEGRA